MPCRLAYVQGKGGRPSIVITQAFEIYLGNEDNAAMSLDAVELFGFNVGAFEQRVVRDASAFHAGVPWRLQNDFSLVAQDKTVWPLCSYLHHLVTQKGIAELAIEDHEITNKMHAQATTQFQTLLGEGFREVWIPRHETQLSASICWLLQKVSHTSSFFW